MGIRQAVDAAVAFDGQVQASDLVEEALLAAFAGGGQPGHGAHQAGQAGRLRVHQPGSGGLPEGARLGLGGSQALADQVAQPGFEIVQPGADFAVAFRGAAVFCAGGSFGGRRRFAICPAAFGFGAHALIARRAFGQPQREPFRRGADLEGAWLAGKQQKKPQAVLAGQLAAGAGALISRPVEVHLAAVGVRAGAADLAPQHALVRGLVLAERQPFARAGQPAGILAGGFIGREGENLFRSPREGHRRPETVFVIRYS